MSIRRSRRKLQRSLRKRKRKSRRRLKRSRRRRRRRFKMRGDELIKINDDTQDRYVRFQKGAIVDLVLKRFGVYKPSKWTTLTENINYEIYLGKLYSSWKLSDDEDIKESVLNGDIVYNPDNTLKRLAPKGLPRILLCNLIQELLDEEVIENYDTILIDTDSSPDQKLLRMYESMGFEIKGYYTVDRNDFESEEEYEEELRNTGAVMTVLVTDLLEWCRDNKGIDIPSSISEEILETRKLLKQNEMLNDYVGKTIKLRHNNELISDMTDEELVSNMPVLLINKNNYDMIKPYIYYVNKFGIKSDAKLAGRCGIMIIEGMHNLYILSVSIGSYADVNIIDILIQNLDPNSDGDCLKMNIMPQEGWSSLDSLFYGIRVNKESCSIVSKDNTKNVTTNIFSLFDLISLKFGVNYSRVMDESDLKKMRGRCDFAISLANYLILKRGYTYYNGRGFMPIQIELDDNDRLQGDIDEYIRLGNIKLEDYKKYIRNDIPDTFDTKEDCKLFEKHSDNLQKNQEIKSVLRYRGGRRIRASYPWKNQAKLYNPDTNEVSVLDTSSGKPKFKMEKYQNNF